MSFSEERLDLGYDYGTVATITTKTSIIESKNGTEQRTPQWYQPLLQFNIGERSETNDQLDQFIEFYTARKGAFQGFRFKDWSDYQFSTIITLNANRQAQLFKAYFVAGFTVKRPLVKIVPGSILVSVGNSPLTTGWTVDFNTGIITFDQVQPGPIQVSGEFDVPVRFADDKINLRFEAFEACEPESSLKLFSLENLSLTEIRINPTLALSLDQIPQSLDHVINLGYDYGTIGGVEFATKINQSVSGQEQRISEWATSRGSWEVGARTLIKSDLDYLISLFRVCRGKAVGFKYFDWGTESQINVRFGEDAIAFRFDAFEKQTGEVIFNLFGLPLIAISEVDRLVNLIPNTALSIDGFGSTTNSGVIQADIPANSTIQKAYLYATSVWDNPVYGVTFDGNALSLSSATILSPDSNPATTVRWDVTSIIASSVIGGLQNFSITENGQNDGAVLVVAYSNPSTQGFTSVILDGELSTGGDVVEFDFASPYTGGDFLVSLASSFSRQPAAGQQQYTLIDVTTNSTNNRRLTRSAGGADDRTSGENSANGNLITVGGIGDNPANVNPTAQPSGTNPDDEYYNLALGNSASATPFILPGDTFVRLKTVNPSGDDNVFGMFITSKTEIISANITSVL